MRVFLDANILVSVLNKEYPLFPFSSRILSLTEQPNFEIYTSPICLAIAWYFSEKKSGTKQARRKMELLCSKIKIAANVEKAVFSTLTNKNIHDFEDGLEYYAALNAGCECIITENKADFYFSEIPVFACEEFIKYLK